MIDFVFAIIAAGINTAGNSGDDIAKAQVTDTPAEVAAVPTVTVPTPKAPGVTAPAITAPTTPSVSIGENVAIGSGSVVIGGNLLGGTAIQPAPSGGGLLDGTSDESAAVATSSAATPLVAPAQGPQFNMSVVPAGLTAEPQDATGKFTTATEVKPILTATKGSWVAVREYDGKDLLYVTHIWGWRCGLKAMAISVNGEAMQNWPLPPCHMKYTTPNAMLEDDGLPYLSLRLGAVETIDIQIVYDDLSMDAASFERSNVLIP